MFLPIPENFLKIKDISNSILPVCHIDICSGIRMDSYINFNILAHPGGCKKKIYILQSDINRNTE